MPTSFIIDHTEAEKISAKLKTSVHRLRELAPQTGVARQVKEFCGDRRKALLARYMLPAIKAGETAAAADAIARASEAYKSELEILARQYEDAEKVLAEWSAEQAVWESARSLLSFAKSTLEHVE